MTVHGQVANGYEHVRDAFAKIVADGRDTGAGLSITRGGEEVVQLSGGWADTARTRPWQPDTLVHSYSTAKPFTALTALTAVAAGRIGLDTPVADVWPEYAAGGKAATTLRHILTHRAGLPAFPAAAADLDLLDDAGLRAALAAAPAQHEPGTVLAEHALTLGHLVDGVLRGATGRSLGEVYAQDVRPALDIDAWFGVPESELGRVADLEHALPGGAEQFLTDIAPSYRQVLAAPTGSLDPDRLNTPAWRRAVFGAIGLHTSAAALSRFYGRLTSPDGPVRQLLGPELHEEFVTRQVCGLDRTVGRSIAWTLGPLRTDAIIGLGGIGGSAAWWSFGQEHAVGYVTRRLHDHSRVAEIAIALGDNLNTEVKCD